MKTKDNAITPPEVNAVVRLLQDFREQVADREQCRPKPTIGMQEFVIDKSPSGRPVKPKPTLCIDLTFPPGIAATTPEDAAKNKADLEAFIAAELRPLLVDLMLKGYKVPRKSASLDQAVMVFDAEPTEQTTAEIFLMAPAA